MQKREIIFVYLSYTSHFMHFQSVRQKKWNIHNKTNKYWWHFRSKPHQTTSLIKRKHLQISLTAHALCLQYIYWGSQRINYMKLKKYISG